jgi:ABC-type branched-subunit amino acid transport system substrate-binding protein
VAFAKAAQDAGMKVTAQETITGPTMDFAALIDKLKAGSPDELLVMPGGAAAGFFKAYEASGWKVPVSGRADMSAALNAVSPAFREAGGLANMTAIVVYSPFIERPGVQAFVKSYEAHYVLVPTQRSFFVYEAVYLVADAIKRAHAATPAAIEAALKTTKMPSRLGGTYAVDDHNHAHTPLFIFGLRDGKPAVVATE